ncbi:MAG: SxtJ family membrane protein [Bacteroidota bacterium]
MSWIKDVTHEIKNLDISRKSLVKFGMMVGGIFLLFSLLFMYKQVLVDLRIIFLIVGAYLFIGGILSPARLTKTYKVWMGFAFALGWIVSRIILTILFIFVMTPVGLVAKLFGKKFLDIEWKDDKTSYWIEKEHKQIDYEKMY